MEDRLFTEREGAPTTQGLRHFGNRWPQARRDHWRQTTAGATGITLPDAAQERTDPQGSDGTYETAVAQLRNKTRDKRKYSLVFQELRNFGYERNLLAVRPIGVVICAASLALLAVLSVLQNFKHYHGLSELSLLVGVLADLGMLAFWFLVPSKGRWLVGMVRRATS